MHIMCPFSLALSKGDFPSVERMLTSALSFTRVSIQRDWSFAAAYRTALQPSLKSNCCEVKMQGQKRLQSYKLKHKTAHNYYDLITNNPQKNSNFNPNEICDPNNSLVALQHVSICTDESLHARNVTSKRCHQYGRRAVPARARISAHPNTSLPCPCNRKHPPHDQIPHSTPQHKLPQPQPSILIQTTHSSHCSTSAFARMRASTHET